MLINKSFSHSYLVDIYVLGAEYHREDNSLYMPPLLKRRADYWLRNVTNIIPLFHPLGVIRDFLSFFL